MAYSRVVIPGDGTTTQITASFALGVISQSDVKVYVTGENDGAGNIIYRDYTLITPTLYGVQGDPAPVGEFYVVERRVSKEELVVDWESQEPITEENLNIMQKQAIMISHEALDNTVSSVIMEDGSEGATLARGAAGTVPMWNAGGQLIEGPTSDNINNAQGSANAAAASASASAGSASASAGSASAAATSASLASEWAQNAEDVPVSGTSGLGFSAKHYAAKALAYFVNGFSTAIHAATSKNTLASADELGIADSAASWISKKISLFNLAVYMWSQMGNDKVIGCETLYVNNTTIQMKTGSVFYKGKLTTYGSAMTKNLAATFTAGNNGGFLDTGAMAASKSYFVHAIRNLTTGVGDWVASLQYDPASVSMTNLSGWEVLGRVNVVLTTSGNVIRQFTQDGNEYRAAATVSEISGSAITAADWNLVQIPTGISTEAYLMLIVGAGNNSAGALAVWTDFTGGTVMLQNSLNVVSSVETRFAGKCRTRVGSGVLRVQGATSVGSMSYTLQSTGFNDYTIPRDN
ncbi:tail fiber protein [Rhizobium phage Palo]|uniref:Tail fiber protein n=1 Tax=Rhizobium phage Palo TaxID=2767573 RepID=A0A7L8G701_9CAUD|nr:tail fiber protein [Rhizobium phage Palo]